VVPARYVGAFVLLAGLTYAHLTDTLQVWIAACPTLLPPYAVSALASPPHGCAVHRALAASAPHVHVDEVVSAVCERRREGAAQTGYHVLHMLTDEGE
jgi:hypothetical protein